MHAHLTRNYDTMRYFQWKLFTVLFIFCATFFPMGLVAQEKKEDKLSSEKTEVAPFLFNEVPRDDAIQLKQETPQLGSAPFVGTAAPLPQAIDYFMTPDGNIDMSKLVTIGVLVGFFVLLSICLFGILTLMGIFREPKHFKRNRAFVLAWTIFQQHKKFFVFFTLGLVVISLSTTIISSMSLQIYMGLSVVVFLIGFLLLLTGGTILCQNFFNALEGKRVSVQVTQGNLFLTIRFFTALLLFIILSALPLVIATVVFAFVKTLFLFYAQDIPIGYPMLSYILIFGVGLYFSILIGIRTSFVFLIAVDKKINLLKTLSMSWEMTKGKAVDFFFLYFLLFLMNVLGLATLVGIGLLFTIPLTISILAATYKVESPESNSGSL